MILVTHHQGAIILVASYFILAFILGVWRGTGFLSLIVAENMALDMGNCSIPAIVFASISGMAWIGIIFLFRKLRKRDLPQSAIPLSKRIRMTIWMAFAIATSLCAYSWLGDHLRNDENVSLVTLLALVSSFACFDFLFGTPISNRKQKIQNASPEA